MCLVDSGKGTEFMANCDMAKGARLTAGPVWVIEVVSLTSEGVSRIESEVDGSFRENTDVLSCSLFASG